MRDCGQKAVVSEVGVTTGGCNIQFAIDPESGRMIVIEMNPRVSSLVGARLQGHRLSRSPSSRPSSPSATRSTSSRTTSPRSRPPASSPAIDYVVTKIPRFTFEKFKRHRRHADHPDEVGGRGDVASAAPSASRSARPCSSMEIGTFGFRHRGRRSWPRTTTSTACSARPNSSTGCGTWPHAFRRGAHASSSVHERTRIDPWFLHQIEDDHRVRAIRARPYRPRARPSCSRTPSACAGPSATG